MDKIEQAREALTIERLYPGEYEMISSPDGSCVWYEDHIAALARLSPSTPVDGVGAEPVAWRFKWRQDSPWTVTDIVPSSTDIPGGPAVVAPLYAAPLANPEAEARLQERVADSRWENQARQATSVIAMIRAMIGEMFGPVIESEEATLLRGPEAKHSGEAILEALQKIEARLAQAESGPAADDESELLTIAYMMGSHDAKKRQSEGGPAVTDPYDLQLLAHLKRDNVAGGARPVIEGDMKAWDQARRLSKEGYIAIEQMGRGGALHITLKGVAALEAALHPQSAAGEEEAK